jgi:hypothetical protein
MTQQTIAMEKEEPEWWGAKMAGSPNIRMSAPGKTLLLLNIPETADLIGTVSAPIVIIEDYPEGQEKNVMNSLTIIADNLIINNQLLKSTVPFGNKTTQPKFLKLMLNGQDIQQPQTVLIQNPSEDNNKNIPIKGNAIPSVWQIMSYVKKMLFTTKEASLLGIALPPTKQLNFKPIGSNKDGPKTWTMPQPIKLEGGYNFSRVNVFQTKMVVLNTPYVRHIIKRPQTDQEFLFHLMEFDKELTRSFPSEETFDYIRFAEGWSKHYDVLSSSTLCIRSNGSLYKGFKGENKRITEDMIRMMHKVPVLVMDDFFRDEENQLVLLLTIGRLSTDKQNYFYQWTHGIEFRTQNKK